MPRGSRRMGSGTCDGKACGGCPDANDRKDVLCVRSCVAVFFLLCCCRVWLPPGMLAWPGSLMRMFPMRSEARLRPRRCLPSVARTVRVLRRRSRSRWNGPRFSSDRATSASGCVPSGTATTANCIVCSGLAIPPATGCFSKSPPAACCVLSWRARRRSLSREATSPAGGPGSGIISFWPGSPTEISRSGCRSGSTAWPWMALSQAAVGSSIRRRWSDKRLWIGDASSQADIDELICRDRLDAEGSWGLVATVYRDYFRTAPYDGIRMDLKPLRVPADSRAVAGFEKQLGLLARREGRWEPITDFAVRYCQWGYFDAKPFITWASTDTSIAAVDANGRVKALKPGRCAIFARFRQHQDRLFAGGDFARQAGPRLDLPRIASALSQRRREGPSCRGRRRDRTACDWATSDWRRLPAGAEVRLDLAPISDRRRLSVRLRRSQPQQTFSATVDRGPRSGRRDRRRVQVPVSRQAHVDAGAAGPERTDRRILRGQQRVDRADRRPADPTRLRSQGAQSRVWPRSGSTMSAP